MENLRKIYKLKNKKWTHINYFCDDCSRTVTFSNYPKHTEKCKKINKSEGDKFMPIQVITIKGERYYRWGDHGKPYKNRADAEKQAQAAYASGYKEPKKDMQKK